MIGEITVIEAVEMRDGADLDNVERVDAAPTTNIPWTAYRARAVVR